MSLMQDTAEINKTDKQVYLVTMVRQSTDMPMYIDHMIYSTPAGGQKFMTKLVAAFAHAGYRDQKIDVNHYKLNNGLDKITLTGKVQDIYND
jgi:hypothetical protein